MNYFEVGNYKKNQPPKTDRTTFFVHTSLIISIVLYFNGFSWAVVVPYVFFTMLTIAFLLILYRGLNAQENSAYKSYFKRINIIIYLRIFFYVIISLLLYSSGHTVISIIWMIPLFIILLFKL